jgi:PKD repeat protein
MKVALQFLMVCIMAISSMPGFAQLQNGADAKDFTVTDLDGNTWNLFSLLDEGKVVYIEFSATWCGPCWNYHNAGHLKDVWNERGPNATDEAFVFFIEGDLNTSTSCLYGPPGPCPTNTSTQGNWVSTTPFPIVDLDATNIGIRYDYQIAFWPTIYAICPQTKKVYLAGQRNKNGHFEYISSCAMDANILDVGDASCYGASDGYVNIEVIEGTQPFTYQWSNNASTQNLSNAPAGTYYVTITDKNQIKKEFGPFVINQPDEITATSQITIESCPGYEDGAISLDVGGGAGNFSFLWSNGFGSQDIEGIGTGNYTVAVTDQDGCEVAFTYFVGVNPAPIANAGDDDVITCAFPLVTLDGTGSEPVGASYEWTTQNGHIVSGANTRTPVVNKEGTYELKVTFFATGCFSMDETEVFDYTETPLTDAGPNLELSCAIPIDTLDGSGSQQGGGFTYLWTTDDGNIVSGASTLHPVVDAAGTYVLVVTNEGNGCIGSDTTAVTYNTNLAAPTGDYAYVANYLQVSFESQVSGNPSSYAWHFGDGNTSSEQNPTHLYEEGGTYEVCLYVSNACGSDTTCYELEITQGSFSVAVVQIIKATCNHNAQDGGIVIQIAGGTPDYTFSWSNGATTQDLAEVPAGSYSVTVTDSDGEAVTLQHIVVGAEYTVNIDQVLVEHLACYGEATGVIALDITSTGGAVDFDWSHDPDWEGSTANNLPAGSYIILITDPNGCTDETTVTLTQPDELLGELDITHAEEGKNNGAAVATVSGGTAPYSYAWSNGGWGSSQENLAPGEYSVKVTDANDCEWEESFVIEERTTSTETLPGLQSLHLYPNPSRGEIYLEMTFQQIEQVEIRVRNVLGSPVYEKQTHGDQIIERIPLTHLAPGVYLMEVRTAEGRTTRQFLIQ